MWALLIVVLENERGGLFSSMLPLALNKIECVGRKSTWRLRERPRVSSHVNSTVNRKLVWPTLITSTRTNRTIHCSWHRQSLPPSFSIYISTSVSLFPLESSGREAYMKIDHELPCNHWVIAGEDATWHLMLHDTISRRVENHSNQHGKRHTKLDDV